MDILVFNIVVVDRNNTERKQIIGKCFNLGLAKMWAEQTAEVDKNNLWIVNKETGQIWRYYKKEKKWR